MTRYSTPQTQRSRHLLNREALKRSHRRGDLIRTLPDVELAVTTTPSLVDDAKALEKSVMTPRS
ncbi:MAG TPA: hypothetical protein DCS43_09505 [Verrucomicrobia bacterium]|nr:hypothetical protein [Verrucomicrobiota bacterium]